MTEEWCSPSPEATSRLMADVGVPWWFAGGWAIELFLGSAHRTHADVDLGCFRRDIGPVLDHLGGWDIRSCVRGELRKLEVGSLADPAVHALWCRPAASACWVLEILFENREADDWVYRRDPRIRRPAREIVGHTAAGLCYLRPEVQLLYKSKDPRPRDQDDFAAAWPGLDADARAWLTAAIQTTAPRHPWLDFTRGEQEGVR